ncbi:MAG TPA: ATP-binding protein [Solirubrobacteraceae bacterium]|nr:ATP-binding protein [Solirubrobacteraceae bacterium]
MSGGRRGRRLRVRQVLGLSTGLLLVVAVIGVGLALAANARLTSQRAVVLDQIAPAQLADLSLQHSLVDEETGIRGYLLTGEADFLALYRSGVAGESSAYAQLTKLDHGGAKDFAPLVSAVASSAATWRAAFVDPALATHGRTAVLLATSPPGRARFAVVTVALGRLRSTLSAALETERGGLFATARVLKVTLFVAGGLVLLGVLGAGIVLRRTVITPLERLGLEARRVAGGEFDTPLATGGGAREIVDVGGDVDAMRERIVRELALVEAGRARLDEQALELRRSNAELEQFAYVASHDLQEPLRKIASFCQALERRYRGQLDDRADQYIDFAVDGAKRMQILINDLLSFSRVGRTGRRDEVLDANELVARAESSLANALDEAGASVVVGDLPSVRGDRALLESVFQNLIANAVKFRGDEAPVVHVDAVRAESDWEFSCADNGIGIDPEYAERIFVIFQRLHAKETYPGTGIGLAMCRKIVEYHGGRIWLDGDRPVGACFRFTLPIIEEEEEAAS